MFVEFDSISTVEKLLNADPKPTWNGQELLVMSKCVTRMKCFASSLTRLL